jgi:hypothetical protein
MTTDDKIKQLSIILMGFIDALDNACTSDTRDDDHSHYLFDAMDKATLRKLQDSIRELL